MRGKVIAVLVLLSVIFMAAPVSAAGQQGSESGSNSSGLYGQVSDDERAQKIADMQSMSQSAKCEKVKDNIDKRVNYYNASQQQLSARYQTFLQNMESAQERLHQLDVDSTELDQAMLQLEQLIQQMTQVQSQFAEQMQVASSMACSASDSELKGQLSNAKSGLQAVKDHAVSINSYVQNDLKEALQTIKDNLL